MRHNIQQKRGTGQWEGKPVQLSLTKQEVVQALLNVVNVAGGGSHQVAFRGSSSLPRGF
jgi:hypothetical protein